MQKKRLKICICQRNVVTLHRDIMRALRACVVSFDVLREINISHAVQLGRIKNT